MIENIINNSNTLAIIIRSNYNQEGIKFFTPSEFSQQLGYMNRPKGYEIAPHFHKKMDEVFSILYSRAIFFSFTKKGTINKKILLNAGKHNLKFVKSNEIHLLLPLSNYVIFHETHKGPFNHISRNFHVPTWFSKKSQKNRLIFYNKLRSIY